MGQLLVRGLEEKLIRKLKAQARKHGVSAEEEHRRILRESLSKAADEKPTLLAYLSSPAGEVSPEVELDVGRNQDTGASRETKF